jgi:hypothetical protein
MIVGWFALGVRRSGLALALATLACLAAGSLVVTAKYTEQLLVGYYFWLASILTFAAGVVVLWLCRHRIAEGIG